MRLVAPLLLASLLAAAPAASAHDGPRVRFPFPPHGAPMLRTATPRFAIDFGGCRPRHEHGWIERCEREWSAPLYATRIVGWDCHRRPIRQRVLVRAGCWTEVRWRVCGCGARIRG